MEFRYIQYVGKQTDKYDRLYGSGVKWSQYGDIEPVPADKAPRLLQHPDEFVEVDEATYQRLIEESDDHGIDTDALERARARVRAGKSAMTDGSADSEEPGSGEGENPDGDEAGGLADVDKPGGEGGEGQGSQGPQKPTKPVSQLSKGELVAYAQAQFGEEIDPVKSRDNILSRVRELMAENGLG